MMSWPRLVFHILVVSDLNFSLGLCLVFNSRAPKTCSGRERENHGCDREIEPHV